MNDDEECAARQMVRHVCVALKRYMESHLFFKSTQMSRLSEPPPTARSGIQLFRVSTKYVVVGLQLIVAAYNEFNFEFRPQSLHWK